MGKGKNKCKEGGQESTSKVEEDPILATLLARPEKSSRGGEASVSSPISVKQVQMDGRSIAVMFKNGATTATEADIAASKDLSESPVQDYEKDNTGKQLEAATDSVGEKDTAACPPTVRQNDYESKTASDGGAEGRAMEETPMQPSKKPFASLFANNRLPSQGSKLEFYNLEEGRIILREEDTQTSSFPWERCLVGDFGGKFPGKQALNQIVASWKAKVTIKYHGSGWIVFQFHSGDEQTKVLENGPYIIYGRPLLLKSMPKYFSFGKAAISAFPVWVQLRNMPLYIWNPVIIGKMCSRIGRPLHMDNLTVHKERITYARCLVEVDMSQDLVQSVLLTLPDGEDYE